MLAGESNTAESVQLAQCPPALFTQTPYGKAEWGELMVCQEHPHLTLPGILHSWDSLPSQGK